MVVSSPFLITRASLAPSSRRAVIAEEARPFARASNARPSVMRVMIIAPVSKNTASSAKIAQTEYAHATDVPSEMSVSIEAPNDLSCFTATMWNWAPIQNTTGVASAHWTSRFHDASGPSIANTMRGALSARAIQKRLHWVFSSSEYFSTNDWRSSSSVTTRMSYPIFLTAVRSDSGSITTSDRTFASAPVKFTTAVSTPSCLPSTRSILLAHAAQVMPSTSKVSVSG